MNRTGSLRKDGHRNKCCYNPQNSTVYTFERESVHSNEKDGKLAEGIKSGCQLFCTLSGSLKVMEIY